MSVSHLVSQQRHCVRSRPEADKMFSRYTSLVASLDFYDLSVLSMRIRPLSGSFEAAAYRRNSGYLVSSDSAVRPGRSILKDSTSLA
jgi:hypothetical protein